MGAAGQVAAQAAGDLRVVALAAQVLRGYFRQQRLLGEHPGAEADQRFLSGLGESCEQQDAAQYQAQLLHKRFLYPAGL
ncbi:hypothetical protein D3C78_1647180 [compost metagenome]